MQRVRTMQPSDAAPEFPNQIRSSQSCDRQGQLAGEPFIDHRLVSHGRNYSERSIYPEPRPM